MYKGTRFKAIRVGIMLDCLQGIPLCLMFVFIWDAVAIQADQLSVDLEIAMRDSAADATAQEGAHIQEAPLGSCFYLCFVVIAAGISSTIYIGPLFDPHSLGLLTEMLIHNQAVHSGNGTKRPTLDLEQRS